MSDFGFGCAAAAAAAAGDVGQDPSAHGVDPEEEPVEIFFAALLPIAREADAESFHGRAEQRPGRHGEPPPLRILAQLRHGRRAQERGLVAVQGVKRLRGEVVQDEGHVGKVLGGQVFRGVAATIQQYSIRREGGVSKEDAGLILIPSGPPWPYLEYWTVRPGNF